MLIITLSCDLMEFTGFFVNNGRYRMNLVFPVCMAASEEGYRKFNIVILQLSHLSNFLCHTSL